MAIYAWLARRPGVRGSVGGPGILATMRRFLRPWWVVSHVLVLALLVLMVNLGFWQLRRLEERRDLNALQAERTATAVVPVGTTWPPRSLWTATLRAPSTGWSRRWGDRVCLLPRLRRGGGAEPHPERLSGRVVADPAGAGRRSGSRRQPGMGAAVLQRSVGAARRAPAPAGEVVVRGVVRLSEQRVGADCLIPIEVTAWPIPPMGAWRALARPDIERYAAQLDYPVHPFYLQLNSQDPPPGDYPLMVPVALPRRRPMVPISATPCSGSSSPRSPSSATRWCCGTCPAAPISRLRRAVVRRRGGSRGRDPGEVA